jgi:hypothetical protein
MSTNEKKGRQVQILIEWDEGTNEVRFKFSSEDPMRNIGMLELCKEAVLARYREQNIPKVLVPKKSPLSM